MSQQGTMMITVFCLLPLFSHLQPVKGETTGELLQSVGKQTQKENYDEIVCTFNVNVSLSRVDFVDNTGTDVFAIVDCGTSCNVLSSYQDVLRIVSPDKTISGDCFVFNASHSDKTTGTYTCHGIPAPQVVYTTPSGTGHGDGDGDGNGNGGSSNGLLALIIIPILAVLIVLFLHWCGVIQIPGLPKSRRQPRDLRRIVGNLLQPVTRCWERTRGLWQSTGEDNQDPLEGLESNRHQDEEACVEAKELLGHNKDKLCLHHDKMSFEDDGNDGIKEEQPLLHDVHNNTKHTQGGNASVGDSQTSLQSTLSPNSTDTKDVDSDVDDRQTSLQSLHLSSSTKATDVAADLSATSLSRDNIQHKEESPHTTSHSSTPHDTVTLKPEPTNSPVPPKREKQRLKEYSSVTDHKENDDDYKTGRSSQTSTESENDDVSKKKRSRDSGVSLQHTPQTSDTRVETDRRKNEIMSGQLKTSLNTEGIEGTEKREDEKVRVDMKEEERSEAKSETLNNDDLKEQLTTDKNKEDVGEMKETDDDKEEVEMKENETLKIKSLTESNEDAKPERIEETMAAKVKQEHKEETKREVEHSQKLEAEAAREQKGNNEDDDYETASEASDDDDADRSRNVEGAVDVDNLDGASSTGQNLVYTDLSLPEQSQECSDGEKRQTIRGRLKSLSSKYNQFDDSNSLDV